MLAELVPPKVLPRVLTRFDLVTIYFALIFGSYGAAQMAGRGWAGIPMLTLAAITFLVPCALASYELGTLFPGEGGIYIWAHKTFGPVHGFVAGWLSWVPIFLLLPLGASTIVAHLQVALGHEWPLWAQVACQVGIVVLVTTISLARLAFSQRFVRWLFFISFGTAVAVILAGLFGHVRGTPVDREIVSLDLSRYGSLYSAAILWLLGVEVPFNMGAEFGDHKRTAGTMFFWGSIALLVGYYLGIAGILLTTPVDAIDATTGVAKGVGRVVPWLGSVVAIAISGAVLSQDVTYMNAYSRLLFISGVERRLPSVMGQVTERSRVPVPALLVQALGSIVVILIFASQTQLAVAFNLYIGALVVVWCAALFYLYVGVVRARQKFAAEYEARANEIWRIPGGPAGLWFAAIWGFVFNAVAIYYVFAIPLTANISAQGWRLWLGAISAVVVITGVAIFAASQRTVAALNVESELKKYARFDAKVE
jgi:amino acid transporter